MASSLGVPTATSVRDIPAKLLIDNRIVINNHLRRGRGGKVSFTHLIGYAVVRALDAVPAMNDSFAEDDGKPVLVAPDHVNLGLAIDVSKDDGSRQLLVPNIKGARDHGFPAVLDRVRGRRAQGAHRQADGRGLRGHDDQPDQPGHHRDRALDPAADAGAGLHRRGRRDGVPGGLPGRAEETLARLAVSRQVTLTSTYDHRIIQGAQSGEFLQRIHQLLLGEDGFYDDIFTALQIPYEPVRWVRDIAAGHENDITKPARVQELIHAYRVRGHLMADTNPLEFPQRKHPDLDINQHGLTLWDLEREFATGGFGGQPLMKLRKILGVLRDSYCRTVGVEYMHIQEPDERAWIQARIERPHERPGTRRADPHPVPAERGRGVRDVPADEVRRAAPVLAGGRGVADPAAGRGDHRGGRGGLDEAVLGMAHRGRLNVLANIVGKSYGQIFNEFEGNMDPRSTHGSGDVKYHLGADGMFKSPDGTRDPDHARGQPQPPGGRRPGARGRGAGQAGRARQGQATAASRCCPC